MTRQQIRERAWKRRIEEAQDRRIRIENARVARLEKEMMQEVYDGFAGLLKRSAALERRPQR